MSGDAELDALLVGEGWKERSETTSEDAWRRLTDRAIALLGEALGRPLVVDPTWVSFGAGYSIDVRDGGSAPTVGQVRIRAIVGASIGSDRLTNQAAVFFYVDGVRVAPPGQELLWLTLEPTDGGRIGWRVGGWECGFTEDEYANFATFDAHRTCTRRS